jgi:hypothetical protein
MVDGHNAGPPGLHILIVFEDIILPRGVFPVNFSPRNLRLKEEDLGTYEPDVPGTLGTWSI